MDAADLTSQQREFFEAKIRPILAKHCYECHSKDADELGGRLRLDDAAGMLVGGQSGPVLVPGRPDESLLIQSLRYDDLEMPPEAPLSEAVVNDFAKWVSLGAPDPRPMDEAANKPILLQDQQSLWSFYPRELSSIPAVLDHTWPWDPIDHYVLARIEDAGLTPTRDADPRTLVRRLYFDLIGLPPSAARVEAFVSEYSKQTSSQKQQQMVRRLVDSLLSNPQFGVRWGRHWLDVARYGESNGDDGLGRNATFPHAWRYRDYVVDSFNADKPYDHFLIEQIAGDMLPADNAQQLNRQLIATGFLAIGSKPAAAMNKNFAMDVVDDQINVVCTAVMGLSVSCARCHDHKHDPVPTRDYYALAGIFSSTETLYGAAGHEKLTAPPTELHELHSKWVPQQTRPDRSTPPRFPDDYYDVVEGFSPIFHDSLRQKPMTLAVGANVTFSDDEFAKVNETALTGSLPNAGDAYSISFWFRNTVNNDARPITAYLFSRANLGDKTLPGDHLGIGGKHDQARAGKLFVFNGNTEKKSVAGSTVIPPNTWNHIVMVRTEGTVRVFLNGRLEIDGPLTSTFGESTEFSLGRRSDNFAPLKGNVGEFAIFDRAIDDQSARELHLKSGQPLGLEPMTVDGYAMGVREKAKPADAKIHINGDGGKLGPSVPRGFLTAYAMVAADQQELAANVISPEKSGRMELARWLTHPDHPQTSRVMVNRIWMHLMGQGIVTTPDDFGVYGARPSHPQLLDYLADQFVDQGWSVKQLIRSVVLSRTYQLDSVANAAAFRSDPANLWLARHSRRRLDAESVRDSVLKVTHGLDVAPQAGSAVQEIDALINWPPGEATNLHRQSYHRSLYLCQLRHAPPRDLAAFDLPSGVQVQGRREITTLPTQTLFLLNSEFVVERATKLAVQLLSQSGSSNQDRIQDAFRTLLQRQPSRAEIQQTSVYLQSVERRLSKSVQDSDERTIQVWASFCQAMLMTNEFRYVD